MLGTLQQKDAKPLIEKHLFEHQIDNGIQWLETAAVTLPFWEIVADGKPLYQPAVSITDSELARVGPSPGQRQILDPHASASASLQLPDVYSDSAVQALKGKGLLQGEPGAISLVYAPFFKVGYSYMKKNYAAWVDASSGEVLAEIVPSPPDLQLDRKFGALMIAALAAFTIEGVILGPWIGLPVMLVTTTPFYFAAKRYVQ